MSLETGLMSITEVYERHIRPLSDEQRKELLSLLVKDLAKQADSGKSRRITELAGLGKEIWAGVNPDEYVKQLRNEWDTRP
jgi:hypothetical protein